MSRKKPTDAQREMPPAVPDPSFRSSAVARIAHMPVSTLRIWEQRYQAVGPTTAPSGQRLYSASDVQRVLLLRQLTEQGHAISALAALDLAQLQQLAHAHATGDATPHARPARRVAALRVAVVGQALALRLQRPAVLRRLSRRWQVAVVFDSLEQAAQTPRAASGANVDWLLWQAPGLASAALPALTAARQALGARHVAVAYRFSAAAARAEFAATGAEVAREPADDEALGGWLASLEDASTAVADAHDDAPGDERRARPAPGPDDGAGVSQLLAQIVAAGGLRPPRFDDAALTRFAGLSSTIACECPQHVAELLMQLSNFEAYSADCRHRSPADAELHAYLQRVAGVSRALFESALERVARQEGLRLP